MNNEYCLLLPLAAEPAGGFTPSSQIDFLLNHPGKALKEQTLRLTGSLNVQKYDDQGNKLPLDTTDYVTLNSNAGAHSLLNHLIVMFEGSQVELNTEYARFVGAESEAVSSCIELGSLSDDVIELKSVSQDGSKTSLSGVFTLGQSAGDDEGKMPFSIMLRCCLNHSSAPINFSKSGAVRIRMILREPTDVFYAPSFNISQLTYAVENVALRYVIHDELDMKVPVVMERVQYAGQQSLLSSYNTFSTICPSSFDSCFLVFRNSAHSNSTTFAYDPVLNENFEEAGGVLVANYVEWTLQGQDTPLSFPLRTNEEMLTNYIMSHSHSLRKHGINYAKLNNKDQACGYGLGCYFGMDIPSMPLQTTINFDNAITNRYNVYIFYKGKMML